MISIHFNSKNCCLLIVLIFMFAFSSISFSQNVGIGDVSFTPNSKALLEIKQTTVGVNLGLGFLVPRMTWANRPASLDASHDALMFYSTDGDGINGAGFYYWNGTIWKKMFSGANNDYILNQTGQQASSNFNISGDGVIGNNLTVTGNNIIGNVAADANFNLKSTGGIRMMIDNDNDGSEDFAVQNGAATNVLTVTEGGNVTADGNGIFNGNLTLSGSATRTFSGPTDAGLDFKSETGYDIFIDSDNDGTSSVFAIKKDAGTSLLSITEDNNVILFPFGTATGETGGIKFRELAANGSNNVGFRAPDLLGADFIFTLPSSYGTSGYFLQTNAAGGLTWASGSDADDWKLTGNTGITIDGTNFIGTTDAKDMLFKAGGSGVTGERIRLKNSTYEIVFGAGDGAATTYSPILRGPDRTGPDVAGVNVNILSGNGTGTGGSGDLIFKTAPVAASSSTANTMTERMRIVKDGNVGIGGITNPAHLLHLYKDVSTSDGTDGNFIDIENINVTDGTMSGLRFKTNSTASGYFKGGIFYKKNGTNGRGDFYFVNNNAADATDVNTATYTRMVILNGGNVGIGTISPSHLLHVAKDVSTTDGTDGSYVDIENSNNTDATMSGLRLKTSSTASNTFKGGIFYKKTASFGRGDIIFANNSTASSANVSVADSKMTITNNGNVNITSTTITAASGSAKGVNIEQTLTAAANNDKLHALHIKPTFTNGVYTGVDNYGLVVEGYAKASNLVYAIPLWQSSGYVMSNTGGSDLSNCESGLEPSTIDPRGEIQVKLVIRATSVSASTVNFQLRAHNGTTEWYPIVWNDPWTAAATQTGKVFTSTWKDWSAGTNAIEIHINGWVDNNNCTFNSAYLLVRAKP